jgi:hypothetical protein
MENKKDISNRLELLPGFCHSAENAAGALHAEENIREKTDEHGVVWSKVYFGSGSHYKNWLKQVYEVFGEENVAIEPVDFTGLACFTESDDKAFRIWVKKKTDGQQDV